MQSLLFVVDILFEVATILLSSLRLQPLFTSEYDEREQIDRQKLKQRVYNIDFHV